MSNEYIFITDEQYEIAAKNGISRANVYNRVHSLDWKVKRAITEPLKEKIKYGNWRNVAVENGIPKRLFYDRIKSLKWSPEKAATEPIVSAEESVKRANEKRREKSKVSQYYIDLAAKNGIKETTLRARVYCYGYSLERAATEPLKHVQLKKMG